MTNIEKEHVSKELDIFCGIIKEQTESSDFPYIADSLVIAINLIKEQCTRPKVERDSYLIPGGMTLNFLLEIVPEPAELDDE